MKNNIEERIKYLDKNNAADNLDYSALLEKINFKIDEDFLEFIKNYDGASGNINENIFVLFWNIRDLIALNPYYEDIKECEDFFFFGSDGSNYGYAFEKKQGKIVGIDFLEITEHEPEIISETFEEFLNKLAKE